MQLLGVNLIFVQQILNLATEIDLDGALFRMVRNMVGCMAAWRDMTDSTGPFSVEIC